MMTAKVAISLEIFNSIALPCSGRRTRAFSRRPLGRLGATGQRLRSDDAR